MALENIPQVLRGTLFVPLVGITVSITVNLPEMYDKLEL
jgi:hypothetical protein